MMTLESKEHLRNKVHSRLVREGKTAAEIQKVLDSLKARTLDYAEYKAMPQDVASWHEFANSANVDKALDAHKDAQKKVTEKKDANISRMWTGQTTDEETAKCKATAEEFLSRYRHFIRIAENSTVIADRMRAINANPHDLSSFVRAFEQLTMEGGLILNGKIAGICDDEMVGGHALRTHKDLHRFLQPTPTPEQLERIKASRMSADEWKKTHPELQDGPPFVAQRQIDLAIRSLESFEPDYVMSDENNEKLLQYVHKNKLQFNLTGLRTAFNALKGELETKPHTAAGQVVRMTEHEPRETGEPLVPQKLRAKIRSLSSSELLQFYRDNPGAEKAVNAM